MTLRAEIKVVYRDKYEDVKQSSNFSVFEDTLVTDYHDRVDNISASSTETIFAGSSPSPRAFLTAARFLYVKNNGASSVKVVYTNTGSQVVELAVQPGGIMAICDPDVEKDVVVVGGAYSCPIEVLYAGY